MRSSFFLFVGLMLLAACSNEKKLTVEGAISDADGKTLYFEKAGISQTVILDSLQLKANGKFDFRAPAVTDPEFFRLRLGKQYITLAIDSSETVRVDASAADFATGYTVTGSMESQKIKTVTLDGLALKRQLVTLNREYATKEISAQSYTDSVQAVVKTYKKQVLPFIFENPRAAVAYYTLFQRVNGLLIFDPYDKADYPAYGAVATSWDTFHNGSERSKQLTEITLSALSTRRAQNRPQNETLEVAEQNQIEIVLPDMNGNNVKLSDMKGKVVLLDFTAYESDYSGPYNISLAKLYDKFKDKGFTIYQVSVDPDEHFWKVTASNLPWTAVRDKDTIYSRFARSYNVTTLPTSFLLDREGNIVARGSDVKDIETAISKLL